MAAFVDAVYGVDCFECGYEERFTSRDDADEAADRHNATYHTDGSTT